MKELYKDVRVKNDKAYERNREIYNLRQRDFGLLLVPKFGVGILYSPMLRNTILLN